jgi:hypothetical protein
MVLGHLTVTAAGLDLLRRAGRPVTRLATPLVLVGAYLPDVADKPLNHLLGLSGRGYGHSLVVQSAVFGLLWLLFPRRRRGVLSLGFGAAIHLAEDAVGPKVLFAPLLGRVPQAPAWGFLDSLIHFYKGGGPLVWIELLALGYWGFVGTARIFSRGENSRNPSASLG